jgi:hypothetical protein
VIARLGLIVALATAGCVTRPAPEPFVPVDRAVVRVTWQHDGRVTRRDAVLESARDGAIRIGYAPGREIILTAAGTLETPDWRGPAGEAPTGWTVWSGVLEIFQHADRIPDGEREIHAPGRRVALRKSDGSLRELAVVNLDTTESLRIVFPGRGE